jgi:hypothetical protein
MFLSAIRFRGVWIIRFGLNVAVGTDPVKTMRAAQRGSAN